MAETALRHLTASTNKKQLSLESSLTEGVQEDAGHSFVNQIKKTTRALLQQAIQNNTHVHITYMHVQMRMHMHIHMHIHLHIYIYICIYIHLHIHIPIHI